MTELILTLLKTNQVTTFEEITSYLEETTGNLICSQKLKNTLNNLWADGKIEERKMKDTNKNNPFPIVTYYLPQ